MEKLMATLTEPPTLGAVMRGIRSRSGWTLQEMSAKSGIPVSTLSKVEHDRLTLSYDELPQLRQRLNIRMSDQFADGSENTATRVTGSRSIGTLNSAVRVTTDNYTQRRPCTTPRTNQLHTNDQN